VGRVLGQILSRAAAPCVWGNVHWNPRRPAVESCEWVVENSVPYGITLWQPWMQTAFTVRQVLSDTRPDVRAVLTLQGVRRANVRLQNHGAGRAQSTGVTQTRRRDMLCLEEMTMASRWPLCCPRYVKTPTSPLLAYSGDKGLWDGTSVAHYSWGQGIPEDQYSVPLLDTQQLNPNVQSSFNHLMEHGPKSPPKTLLDLERIRGRVDEEPCSRPERASRPSQNPSA
jgi:hypothetical protein